MSIDLYHTRLYFDGKHGSAKRGDVEVRLHAAPHIDGLPPHLVTIDYAPQVRCFDLRESAHGRREMTHGEIEAAETWLMHVAAAALSAAGVK